MVKDFFRNGKLIILRKQSSILSAALVIMVAVAFSRILGLLRDRLLAGRFFGGMEWQLDVYFASFRLPDMIFELVVIGALSAAFIPVFSEYLEKDRNEAYRLASSVINLTSLFFGILALILFIFAPQFSRLIAPSFDSVKINLMVSLTRLMLLAQMFFCVSNFLTGIIQSNQRFLIPALAPIVYNLGIIFAILFLTPAFGIYGVVFGVILGALFHLLVQLPLVARLGFVYHPRSWELRHQGVQEVGRLMIPRTLALAVSQIEATVAVFLATSLTAGSLSIFNFAQHLMNLPIGLFGATIGQAALPVFSQNTAKKDLEEFKKNLLSSFFQVLYLVMPVSAILLILRVPAVRLAFGAKGFPWQATLLTGKTLAFFTMAILSQSVIQILVRGFYALHNTKTPLLVGSLAVLINVGLSLLFIFQLKWGVWGLAAATSIASFFQFLMLFLLLDRRVGGFDRNRVFSSFSKMSLATLTTAVFLWIPMRVLDRFVLNTQKTIDLVILTIIATVIGLLVYFFLSLVLEIEELKTLGSFLKRVGKWKEILAQSEEMIESPPGSTA